MSNVFIDNIAGQLAEATGLEAGVLADLIEVPRNPELGDYALPCFTFAKTMRKAPNLIAEELVARVQTGDRIAQVRATGPYLNFFVSKGDLAQDTVTAIFQQVDDYGKSSEGLGKTVVIDFSHPNIAKEFGIHHLRSTVIGGSLRRIFKTLSYEVVGINHLGDWGSQFAKVILGWKMWGEGELTEDISVKTLLDLYIRINAEIDDNPDAEAEASAWFRRLESGDEEARRMWEVCCKISWKEFERIYDRLGIEFDVVAGESTHVERMHDSVGRLREKGLVKISEGATIVDLEEYDMPPFLAYRSDEASLYATRDLAAAEHRWNSYHFDQMLYVVDVAQSLHFRQLFKVLELMEYGWSERCTHVVFGRLRFKDGAMSTRRGRIILMEDVLNRSVELVRQTIEEKNPDLPDKDAVAEAVGIGAIIFADLDSRRIRDVQFDWDEILNFNGETGPYVQYTYARYRSVLRRFGKAVPPEDADLGLLFDSETAAVIKELGAYPDTIHRAAAEHEPSRIATYLIDLCTAANRFYNAHRVVSDDEAVTKARIALVYAITVVLKNGLALMGIKAPEEM